MAKISGEPHLVNTLIKESQAGILIADERALLDEAAEHLSLDHQRVEPLVGAVAALQEACGEMVNISFGWVRGGGGGEGH